VQAESTELLRMLKIIELGTPEKEGKVPEWSTS
jgi:hypothetical protein